MTALPRIFACLLIACAPACGGKSIEVGPDGQEGGSSPEAGTGGSSRAGTSHGGMPGGFGGTAQGGTGQGGGFGGEGGSGGNACTQYVDQSAWFVQVEILNKTSKTIYLGDDVFTCANNPNLGFTVTSADGRVLPPPSWCRTSCDALIGNNDIAGCPAICLTPSAVTLKPGEQYQTSWSGQFAQQITLPLECTGGSSYRECERAQHVQPGMFTFSSSAGLALDCSETRGTPCDACMLDPNGACTTSGALISGARLATATQVYLDGSYGVWGDTTRTANPAPGASDPITIRPVQLVFTE